MDPSLGEHTTREDDWILRRARPGRERCAKLTVEFANLIGIVGGTSSVIQGDAQVTVDGHTEDRGAEALPSAPLRAPGRGGGGLPDLQGVDPARIASRGFGESRPVGLDDGDQGRRRTRRVEIVIRRR